MNFLQGEYDFLIAPACSAKLNRILHWLSVRGVATSDFLRQLEDIHAEIQLGRCPGDLESVGQDDLFGASIYGFRILLHVDQHEKTLTIVNAEDAD